MNLCSFDSRNLLRRTRMLATAAMLACAGMSPSTQPAAQPASMVIQGRLGDAIPLLQDQVKTNPAAVWDWQQLANIHDWLGDPPAAENAIQHAIDGGAGADVAGDLWMHMAILSLDDGDSSKAIAALDRAVELEPRFAQQAGMLCALFGLYCESARYLQKAPAQDSSWSLLSGNVALESDQPQKAIDAFTNAMAESTTPAQHRYCIERIIAAHRKQKTLGQLADAWLSDKSLPPDRWTPLAVMLRELNRIDDLLILWDSVSGKSAAVQPPATLASEVLNGARYAGKIEETKSICTRMIADHPDDPYWLRVTARAFCDWGDTAGAAAVLEKQMDQTKDTGELHQLSLIGRDLGLRDFANASAGKLSQLGPDSYTQGLLLRAENDRRYQDDADSNALLTEAKNFAQSHPASAVEVANALEFGNRLDDAIALLQETVSSNGYDARLLLAALLAKQGRFAESMAQDEVLRTEAPSEAQRSQASLELLDNAVAAKALPKLIADLKTKLTNGGTAQDVSDLANALLRNKQFSDALALVQSTPILDEKARLNQTVVLLLRAKRRTEAEPVLQRLVAIDPDGAVEHLEELASAATAEKDLPKANDAVDQIQKRLGAGPTSAVLLGNIFDRLSRFADAAASYDKVIAAEPANDNAWILWSDAAAKAGDGLRARQRLQVVAHTATSDSLFATAADSVLNQKPPSFVTRSLRREALYRLVRAPQSSLLWHVLGDLNEELSDSDFMYRTLQCSLPFSDDERNQRLRDLLGATANHPAQINAAIAVGQSMQLMGDVFPAQDYIDLGDELLNAHRFTEARAVLRRAAEETTEDRVTLRVVNLFEKFEQFDEALAVGSPVLQRHAFDADIQLDFAGLNEAAGHYAAALSNNEAAFQINTNSKAVSGPDGDPDQRKMIGLSADSAVATVRSPSEIGPLLAMLKAYAQDAGDTNGPVTAPVTSRAKAPQSPSALFRNAAFELHHPETIARDGDAGNARVFAGTLRSLLNAGLFDLAMEYATAHNLASQLPPGAKWSDTLREDAIDNRMCLPGDADYLVSRMLAAMAIGDAHQADALAQTFQVRPDTTDDQFETVCRVAVTVGDNALANRLALQNISRKLQNINKPASAGMAVLSSTISNSGRFLDLGGRLQLLTMLQDDLTRTTNPIVRKTEVKFLLILGATTGTLVPGAQEFAASQLTGNDNAVSIAGLFLLVPPACQSDFLNEVVADVPAEMKLGVYLTCVARANLPLDPATVAGIIAQISKLPRQDKVLWNGWCYNCAQAAHLGKIADALATIIPQPTESVQSIGPSVACALALAQSGRTADADAMATTAIEHLIPWQSDSTTVNKGMGYFAYEMMKEGDPPPRAYLLSDALSALSPKARHALDDSLVAAAKSSTDEARSREIPAKLAWELLVRSLVKQCAGQQREAFSLLAQSYQLDPADPSVLKLYSELLFAQGCNQKMLETFTDVFSDAPAYHRVAAFVMTAAGRMYRMADQYQQTSTQRKAPSPIFVLEAAMGDSKKLIQSIDRELQSLRQAQFPTARLNWEDPPLGGLQTEVTPRTVELLASNSRAMDLLLANWAFPSVRGSGWVKELLARGISSGTVDPEALAAQLQQRALQKTLNDADRDLIALLSAQPGVKLPAMFLDDAWKAAAFRPTADHFELAGTLNDLTPATTSPATESATQPDTTAIHHHLTLSSQHGSLMFGQLPDQWATSEIQDKPGTRDSAQARQTLHDFQKLGAVYPGLIQFQIQAAKLAAEQSDWTNMRLRVRTAIESWELGLPPNVSSTDPVVSPAIDRAIPESFDSPAQAIEFCHEMRAELESAITRWPGDPELVAALAKVGGQLQQQGYAGQAKEFLQAGMAANQSLCEGDQTLCLADLAERLGDASLAEQMQIDCLKAGCLPVGRIASVITRADPALHKGLMSFVPPNLPALVAPVE